MLSLPFSLFFPFLTSLSISFSLFHSFLTTHVSPPPSLSPFTRLSYIRFCLPVSTFSLSLFSSFYLFVQLFCYFFLLLWHTLSLCYSWMSLAHLSVKEWSWHDLLENFEHYHICVRACVCIGDGDGEECVSWLCGVNWLGWLWLSVSVSIGVKPVDGRPSSHWLWSRVNARLVNLHTVRPFKKYKKQNDYNQEKWTSAKQTTGATPQCSSGTHPRSDPGTLMRNMFPFIPNTFPEKPVPIRDLHPDPDPEWWPACGVGQHVYAACSMTSGAAKSTKPIACFRNPTQCPCALPEFPRWTSAQCCCEFMYAMGIIALFSLTLWFLYRKQQ